MLQFLSLETILIRDSRSGFSRALPKRGVIKNNDREASPVSTVAGYNLFFRRSIMLSLVRWTLLPAVVLGWLLVGGAATAAVPEIKDEAHFFKADTLRKAN